MSAYTPPDLHPGRCLNHRMVGTEVLRCIDYENAEHVCHFIVPTHTITSGHLGPSTIYYKRPAEPWVKPGDLTQTEAQP